VFSILSHLKNKVSGKEDSFQGFSGRMEVCYHDQSGSFRWR
jgi:hypothetical protein